MFGFELSLLNFVVDTAPEDDNVEIKEEPIDEAELSSSEVNNNNRRCTANRRERIRMCQLNKAFYELKKKLPWIPHDTKLTKLEILVFAAQYIQYLTKQLQQR